MRNTPDTSLQHFLSETHHGLGDTVKDALGPVRSFYAAEMSRPCAAQEKAQLHIEHL